MAEEEHTCFGCDNAAPRSAMLEDDDGHWWHLYCARDKGIKEKGANHMQEKTEYVIDAGTQKMIDDSFSYHSPKPDQIPRFTALREQFHATATMIAKYTPPGRERAVALTQLQLANMAANAAIACGEK